MRIDTVPRRTPRAARLTTLALEALTAVGAAAGVQGFLSGAFDGLVEQLRDVLPFMEGRALPAAALGGLVALPQAGALLLGLRRHRLAAVAGLVVGVGLTAWVGLQLPLIGFSSPVQWAFLVIGVAQVIAAAVWRHRTR